MRNWRSIGNYFKISHIFIKYLHVIIRNDLSEKVEFEQILKECRRVKLRGKLGERLWRHRKWGMQRPWGGNMFGLLAEQWSWNMMSEEEGKDRRQGHSVFQTLEMDPVEACRTLSRVLILFRVGRKTTGGLWAEKWGEQNCILRRSPWSLCGK